MKQYFFILFLTIVFFAKAEEKVTFRSADGVIVTADLHMSHPDTATFIILFHQAGWSRGEYMEIAPTLNRLGFNCLAVDLRSGSLVNGVRNETNQDALRQMKQTKYTDAEMDLAAAVQFVNNKVSKGKLVLWGSSYSASLVLKYSGDHSDEIQGVLAFSPGEYFKSMGKPNDYIASSASKLNIPVFITSARGEKNSWWRIYESIPSSTKQFFLPTETSGNHGSKALFTKFSDHKVYWEALIPFLDKLK
ncbi:MAG: alpha/beta hydrolase [Reichenbachiella sp.]